MVQVDELPADRLGRDHDPPRSANAPRAQRREVPAGAWMHVLGADPIGKVGHAQGQRNAAEHRCNTEYRMQQPERAWVAPEAPGQRPLLPTQPQAARHRRKGHETVPVGSVAQIGDHIGRREDVDRGADLVQPPKNVERMVLEPGKGLRRKQEIHRDSFRHRIAASHCRKLAEQRARRASRRFARDGVQR